MIAQGFSRYGGPEVLTSIGEKDPEPGKGDVIIRMGCTSVNNLDVIVRSGRGDKGITLPHVPGCDVAGVVEKTGEGAAHLSIGERVIANTVFGCGSCGHCNAGEDELCREWKTLGMHTHGSYGELVRVPSGAVIPAPRQFSIEELACFPISLSVAWRSLRTLLNAKEGERILLWGASGNVGIMTLLLSKAMGLRVIAVTRSESKARRLKMLGAELVVGYDGEGVAEAVREATGGVGIEMVMESSGATLNESIAAVGEGGRIALFGSSSGTSSEVNVIKAYRKGVRIFGVHNSSRKELEDALEFVTAEGIKPLISKIMHIEDAGEAHRIFERKGLFGKIVLRHDWYG